MPTSESRIGQRAPDELPPPYTAAAQPIETTETTETTTAAETTTPATTAAETTTPATTETMAARTYTQAELDRMFDVLDGNYEELLEELKELTRTTKAYSKSCKKLQGLHDRFNKELSFRIRKTGPAFRWLYATWVFFCAGFLLDLVGRAEESRSRS